MEPKNTGGGLVVLACLALLFLAPGVRWEARAAKGSSLRSTGYHVLRFWGVKSKAPPEVVDSAIDRAADRYGISRRLLRAVAHVESRKDPEAVSPKGATGVLQVMPYLSEHCGLSHPGKLKDPSFNALCGAKILAENLKMFGDEKLALAGFNWGSGNVQNWIKKGRPPGGMPMETQRYVPQVLALAGLE